MAGRTSSGIGVGIAIALLGVVTLALFVLTFIFLGQKQTAEQRYQTLDAEVKDIVRGNERALPEVQALVDAARKKNQSLVGYLRGGVETLTQRISGSKRDTVDDLTGKMDKIPGADAASLFNVIADREGQIGNLTKKVADAEAARNAAAADLASQVGMVKKLQDGHAATIAALNRDLDKYKDEVEQYRAGVNTSKSEMQARVDRVLQEARDKEAELTDRIAKTQEELLIAKNQLQVLRQERSRDSLKPMDEAGLVDGEVIGLSPSDNQVFINRGRRQRVVLGMTFEVYPDAASIRPDPGTGNYPPGKASIEIIKVEENSATGRVVLGSQKRGNQLVKGDVIANALYDPTKTYSFLVYGNFDANRDGLATPDERLDIAALIQEWGGRVTETLTGDVDFLVLGQRPVLPPQPGANAPVALIQEYISQRRTVQEYDRLFEQATATSIPVLNESRLYTLTGR
ncbi:MAG: hypothetical protein JNM07_10330 [Phycisphaerae bacterium]|nr:hypothetical protein [Phycisphaerae bacterium]